MFGIGMPELIVILVVALVVLGPQRLPEVARTLGKAMAEFRRQTSDVLEEFQAQALEEDRRTPVAQTKTPPPNTAPATAAEPGKPDAGKPDSGTSTA